MSRCDRFEREGLLAIERGEALDEHFTSCADCRRERAAYERLRLALGEEGVGAPAAGWQDGVRAEIERRRRRRRERRSLALGGLAAAAAVALVFVLLPGRTGPVTLSVDVERGGRPVRGTAATVGDRLQVTATTGGKAGTEIRVYRDDVDLVLRCSAEPPCSLRGEKLSATVAFDLIGSYQTVLFSSDETVAPPTGAGLDPDVEAVLAAGGTVIVAEEVDVR